MRKKRGFHFSLVPVLVVVFTASTSAATPPALSSPPQVNAATVIADDTTLYTATVTFSDLDGYDNIRCIRVLFGYSEALGNQADGRGYMNWGKTDADVTQYGGAWVIADATGGGRWAYRTDTWGGITYITPRACQTSVSGMATGGSGLRTVTWTFTAKAAWAYNPVMNDVDTWAADGVIGGTTYAVGWIDGLVAFDVVSASCTIVCTTPQPPVLVEPTSSSVKVSIHPNDAGSDLYTIMVSPSVGGRMFIQPNGSLDQKPCWANKNSWGTTTVTGLLPKTTYAFSVRASRSEAGYCPSAWGTGTQVTTGGDRPVINYYLGTPFGTGVRGQCPYRSVSASAWEPIWDLTIGSMARGLAGGLDADTYDWRDIDSGSGWGTPTWSGKFNTLQYLQHARDHQATPILTANMFGGGYRAWSDPNFPGVFVCQSVNPDGLAADWVRFNNFILQNYRQGDEGNLTGEDLRIYNSIANWGTNSQLLTPTEGAVPKVRYWEIGNEPELPGYGDFLTDHYLSPTDYRDRYKLMAAAMLAVDADLKIGPCLITPHDPSGSGQWLAALAADPQIPVDFIGYHPYYGNIKSQWGHFDGMTSGLRDYKKFLNDRSAGIRTIMGQYTRTGYDLIASEWDPVNWDAPGYMQGSMANALGVAETCFTFAEAGVLGGTFWEQPQGKLGVKDTFAELVSRMGNVLVTTGTGMGYEPTNANFRIYVTKNQGDDSEVMIWGLNFDDSQPVTVELGLIPCQVNSAKIRRYGKPGADAAGGDSSLTTYTGMGWEEQDITAGFNPQNFSFTMDDAEITVLVLQVNPMDSDYLCFDSVSLQTNGAVQLRLSGDIGGRCEIHGSTNLQQWAWLATVTNQTGTVIYTDTQATNLPQRFYKAIQLP